MGTIGCQTTGLDLSNLRNKKSAEKDYADTSNIKGPMERLLQVGGEKNSSTGSGYQFSENNPEYRKASKLAEQGEYKKAEKEFKKLAKKHKNTPLQEDAMFMLAECQFQQKRYSYAQDSFDELLNEYPSTRHMNDTTKRLFQIARYWLDFEELVTPGDIQQVDFQEKDGLQAIKDESKLDKKRPLTVRVPLLPNLFDRSRPWFDTEGRALQALQSVWLKDPTGPLAADALMMTASYHTRHDHFLEADRFYTLLREEYPKSRHFQSAFELGSHVKLMSYQGPSYDNTPLLEAKELKESTLRIFNEKTNQEMLKQELALIEEEKARKKWTDTLYYEKQDNPKAVAIYCKELIRQYPNSTYADQARQKLAQLSKGPLPKRYLVPPLPWRRNSSETEISTVPKPEPVEEFASRGMTSPSETPGSVQFEAGEDLKDSQEEKPKRGWFSWPFRSEPEELKQEDVQESKELAPFFE